MRIVVVRHGHPNYKDDCLTELGYRHAIAAAERLRNEGISQVYSSTRGRAVETALAFAETRGLEVKQLSFMSEIKWGSKSGEPIFEKGHPWLISNQMVLDGYGFFDKDWRQYPDFADNVILDEVDFVAAESDKWLKTFGYTRKGSFYLCEENAFDGTIALFCHGGSSTALFSHMFNLPFAYLCYTLRSDFTAITVIEMPYKPGQQIMPRFEIANDSRHIVGIE